MAAKRVTKKTFRPRTKGYDCEGSRLQNRGLTCSLFHYRPIRRPESLIALQIYKINLLHHPSPPEGIVRLKPIAVFDRSSLPLRFACGPLPFMRPRAATGFRRIYPFRTPPAPTTSIRLLRSCDQTSAYRIAGVSTQQTIGTKSPRMTSPDAICHEVRSGQS